MPGGCVEKTEWVVIGGGFAGVMTARALARARLGPGVILEQEPVCGMHASGRNAGIFRLAESDPVVRALARQSLRLMRSAGPGMDGLVRRTGGVTLAGEADLPGLADRAAVTRREGTGSVLLPMTRARRKCPVTVIRQLGVGS